MTIHLYMYKYVVILWEHRGHTHFYFFAFVTGLITEDNDAYTSDTSSGVSYFMYIYVYSHLVRVLRAHPLLFSFVTGLMAGKWWCICTWHMFICIVIYVCTSVSSSWWCMYAWHMFIRVCASRAHPLLFLSWWDSCQVGHDDGHDSYICGGYD